MKPGIYRLKEPAFIFEKGHEFRLVADSYDTEVCDGCGLKRKCDWLENTNMGEGRPGFDCCRTCQKKYLEVVE